MKSKVKKCEGDENKLEIDKPNIETLKNIKKNIRAKLCKPTSYQASKD